MILVKIWSIKKEHLQNAVKTTFQRYSLIWRRRESNPRPDISTLEFLHA